MVALVLEIIIFLVLLVFAIPLLLLAGGYVLAPKIKAFVRGRAVVRIIDKMGREKETTAEYKSGTGKIVLGEQSWLINAEDVVTSFPNIPVITVDAEKAKSLSWRDRDPEDAKRSSFNIQALMISVYAAARAGVLKVMDLLKLLGYVNVALGILILVLTALTLLNTGQGLQNDAAIQAALAQMQQMQNATLANASKVV